MATMKNKIGIVCYPTYGGSGVVATELGKALAEMDMKFILSRIHNLPDSTSLTPTCIIMR